MSDTRTIIENAHVLTLDAHDNEHACADILIRGEIIERIGPRLAEAADLSAAHRIDARGMLAMPGLINAHFHSTSTFMKGALEGLHLEPYMLYEAPMKARWETKRVYYLRAMLAAMDMLKVGITSVRDDAHFFSHPNLEVIDGLFEAFRDSGMRASVALGISNVPETEKLPYLDELLTDRTAPLLSANAPQTVEALIALYESVKERWHRSDGGRLSLHGSVSAPQRVTRDYLEALSQFCSDNDMSLDMHVLETKTQRVHGDLLHGKSFVRYVEDCGTLNENTVLIHCVWIDDDDIEAIGAAGAVIAHNPISNLRLGSGVMPFKAIRDRGIPICLGTDEPSVDEASNLWNDAKTGALLQKIADPDSDRWPTARSYVEAMCRGGARAMRRVDEIGSLEAGKMADLILLDLDSLAFTPKNDVLRQLVFSETGSSVKLTMVAGKVLYRNGTFACIDERAIKAEINAFWDEYRADCDDGNTKARELIEIYKAVCMRASRVDVGFSRWLDFR